MASVEHSRTGNRIPYNLLHLVDVFKSRSVGLHIGLKPFLAERLLTLLWLKSFWKRLSLSEELLSNFTMIEASILLVSYFHKSVPFGQFYDTFTALISPTPLVQSGLTTLLRISWQDLCMPSNYLGQKHCLLVLLNHRSTLFGTRKLSPFETVTG